jgi:hypothetical protein
MLYRSLTLALVLLTQVDPPRPTADALLLKIRGDWTVNSEHAQQGMKLFYKQTLRLVDRNPGEVVVLYRTGEKRSCPDQERPVCTDFVVVPPVRTSNGLFERVFSLLEDAVGPESRSVPGLTKAASIPDGIAEIQSGSNIMIRAPGLPAAFSSRSYTLQFRMLGPDSLLGPPIQPNYPWRPGSAFEAANFKPGFYRVNLLDADARPTGDYFLILVYEAGKGGHTAQDFDTLVATTDTWGPQGQADALLVRRLFLWRSAQALGFEKAQFQ